MFFVDEKPLDILLHEHYPKYRFIGLIPAIVHVDDPKDREFAKTSIFHDYGDKTISPILICPDDLDFDCTTIVVDVEVENNCIIWHRVGVLNVSGDRNPPFREEDVEWFDRLGPYQFDFRSYEKCISRLISESESS